MKQINLLIKPASSLCNMRCRYCFYKDESNHRTISNMGIMRPDVMEALIHAVFEAVEPKGSVSFSFQGGEPTIAGIKYFQDFTAAVDEANINHLPISWSIQTNGLALNKDWISFLKKNQFLVGISIDGNQIMHDSMRHDINGNNTYHKVKSNLHSMLSSGIAANILCVVHAKNAQNPNQVYRSLKKLKSGYLQFIPCLDPLDIKQGTMSWSLFPDAYGRFLCTVFDEWYRDWSEGRYVSVRQFDDWVHLAMGILPSTCASCGQCGSYLVVEADGGVYPCDFYALDEWRLGTVQSDLNQLMELDKMRAFQKRSRYKPKECRYCSYFPLCRAGCPRDWIEDDTGVHNYYCSAYQTFFRYAYERILQIARMERFIHSRRNPPA